jgi:hypothetical protein
VALASGIGDSPVPAGLDPYRTLVEDVLEKRLNLPTAAVDVRDTEDASRTIDVRRLERL